MQPKTGDGEREDLGLGGFHCGAVASPYHEVKRTLAASTDAVASPPRKSGGRRAATVHFQVLRLNAWQHDAAGRVEEGTSGKDGWCKTSGVTNVVAVRPPRNKRLHVLIKDVE